ncbi:MAG: glycerol-3-phosphate 1-O-acyltransferase PlsY [Bacilli bacterium]
MHLFIQILLLILAYLLGSIPWGFVFGKMKGIDIREHGSKNIGATNTGRVLGKKYAIITYICDMVKGALIVALFTSGIIPMTYCLVSPIIYGLAAVLGHTFPLYLKFKGGKAVATGGGVLLAYNPILFAIGLGIFFMTMIKSKYVSLGSLIGTLTALFGSIGLYIINIYFPFNTFYNITFPLGMFIIATIIFIRHTSNIQRLKHHEEAKVNWGHKKAE